MNEPAYIDFLTPVETDQQPLVGPKESPKEPTYLTSEQILNEEFPQSP